MLGGSVLSGDHGPLFPNGNVWRSVQPGPCDRKMHVIAGPIVINLAEVLGSTFPIVRGGRGTTGRIPLRPTRCRLLQADMAESCIPGHVRIDACHHVQQQVLAGGRPGCESRAREERMIGVDGAPVGRMQYQGVVVVVHHLSLHKRLQFREIDHHAGFGIPRSVQEITCNGNIEHVRMAVDVSAKTIMIA